MNRKRLKFDKLALTMMTVFLLSSCTNEHLNSSNNSPVITANEVSLPTKDSISQLDAVLDAFLNDGMTLPQKDDNGNTITWKCIEGNCEIIEYTLNKTENANEYEPITLQAEISETSETHEFSRLLLDPYVAYVISYFSENGDDAESLKLAYTYNCTYWFKLNEDQAVLKPSIGTGRLRDPSFLRKKDGSFALIATQGYNTDSIYVYDTKDFITYSNERLLQVNSSEDQSMSGKQAWAPEGFYDPVKDCYTIFWSSVEDNGMYYNLTPDLEQFSWPKKLMDCGFPVIDGTYAKEGNKYVLLLKDERSPMETYSQLFLGYSNNGWENINSFSSPFSGHQSEGPMLMKSLEQEGYFLFYDDYTRFQFKAYYIKDIFNPVFEEINHADLMIPLSEPAHSYAIPVTWKELERLLNAYN